jgi:hypothetical protein
MPFITTGLRNEPNKELVWRRQQTELCLLSKKPAWRKQLILCLNHACFLHGLSIICEDAGCLVLQSLMTFTALHSVMAQKMELFVTDSVRTKNPAILILVAVMVHNIWRFIHHLAILYCDFHIIQIQIMRHNFMKCHLLHHVGRKKFTDLLFYFSIFVYL